MHDPRVSSSVYGDNLVRPVEIRDEVGGRQKLSIWRKHHEYDDLVVNGVYFITRVKVEKFPKGGPPFNLSTLYGGIMKMACPEVTSRFGNIKLCDGTVEGTIEGIRNVVTYEVCSKCTSKVSPALKTCGRCKQNLKNSRIPFYFRYVFVA